MRPAGRTRRGNGRRAKVDRSRIVGLVHVTGIVGGLGRTGFVDLLRLGICDRQIPLEVVEAARRLVVDGKGQFGEVEVVGDGEGVFGHVDRLDIGSPVVRAGVLRAVVDFAEIQVIERIGSSRSRIGWGSRGRIGLRGRGILVGGLGRCIGRVGRRRRQRTVARKCGRCAAPANIRRHRAQRREGIDDRLLGDRPFLRDGLFEFDVEGRGVVLVGVGASFEASRLLHRGDFGVGRVLVGIITVVVGAVFRLRIVCTGIGRGVERRRL